jgi:Family of unknown function (DUF6065)
MKLIAHVIDGHHVDIRPTPVERDWMDATSQRFAYRSLPLNITNAYGWEVLCNAGFVAMWWGGEGRFDRDRAGSRHHHSGDQPFRPRHPHLPSAMPVQHRARRRADGEWPINRPKDGLAALSGVIETDWSPHSFTMNWMFTRPGTPVRFEKGEPYCHIFPVRCGEIEDIEPELEVLSARQHDTWTASRERFNVDLKQPGSVAQSDKWQKLYYRGLSPDGAPAAAETHRTRLRLQPFKAPRR